MRWHTCYHVDWMATAMTAILELQRTLLRRMVPIWRLQRVLLGSVAEGVIRRARTPVLIVKSFGKSLLPVADSAEKGENVGAPA